MAIIIKQIKEINFSVIKDGILCTIFCEYSTSDAPNCGGWFHKIFPRGTNEVKILLEEVIQNPKFLEWEKGKWRNPDVFSKPECIFNYCPHPDLCKKEGCLYPNSSESEPKKTLTR